MKAILIDEITSSHADIKSTNIADMWQDVSDKVDYPKENEELKLNIVVFGVEESASNLRKNKRNEDDTKVFIETCQNVVMTNIFSKDTSKITRLGRKKEDGTPRPILVSMSPKDDKKRL